MNEINVQVQFNKVFGTWDFSVVGGDELPSSAKVELSIAANRIRGILQNKEK